MNGEVIFVDKTKILVKTGSGVVLIIPNEFTAQVKYKSIISFDGQMTEEVRNNKKQTICHPTSITVEPAASAAKQESARRRIEKSPEDRFAEIEKFLNDKAPPEEKSKYLPLAFVLAKQSPSVSEKLQQYLPNKAAAESPKKTTWALSEEQSKFLIPSNDAGNFSKDQILERFGRLIQVSHVGKVFKFKTIGSKQKKFTDGEQVCYVYYYKKEPVFSPEDFYRSTKDYYDFISHIKKNGIKPRHKASEIAEIKKSKAYCDSRMKIEGNSWIAVNDDFLWYITHKLSPISMDNNIKINNQFAQCWRMPLHQVLNKMDQLEQIDIVLFKSSAIPNAQEDDELEDDMT